MCFYWECSITEMTASRLVETVRQDVSLHWRTKSEASEFGSGRVWAGRFIKTPLASTSRRHAYPTMLMRS